MIRVRDLRLLAPGSVEGSDPLVEVPSLDIRHGEYVVIFGPNGSGKSMLIHSIAGLRRMEHGSITFDNTDASAPVRPGILFQNPGDQLLGSTVERDLAFGLESEGVPTEEIRARVDEALADAGLTALRRRPPHLLSQGEMQRVALASVLILRPRILLADEPTARLDADDREHFLDRLREANRSGATVLHVTHRAEEVAAADRVIGLERGRVVFDGPPSALAEDQAEALGVIPRTWAGSRERRPDPRPEPRPEGLRPLVGLREVCWHSEDGVGPPREVLRGASLEIFPGERVGIAGRSGAGKTTLAAILAGLLEPTAGEVARAPLPRRIPKTGARLPVALAFQEPERGFFDETVERDVAFGPRNLGLEEAPARVRAPAALERVGLSPAVFGGRAPETLSGGEARRAGIAGLLALDADLVVLDEPTTGLDAEGIARLREILAGLRRDGVALLLVSHEAALLDAECDRVLHLVDGRLSA